MTKATQPTWEELMEPNLLTQGELDKIELLLRDDTQLMAHPERIAPIVFGHVKALEKELAECRKEKEGANDGITNAGRTGGHSR